MSLVNKSAIYSFENADGSRNTICCYSSNIISIFTECNSTISINFLQQYSPKIIPLGSIVNCYVRNGTIIKSKWETHYRLIIWVAHSNNPVCKGMIINLPYIRPTIGISSNDNGKWSNIACLRRSCQYLWSHYQ